MTIKSRLREALVHLTGYWIFRHIHIPIGCDLPTDINSRLFLPMNTIFDIGANIGQTALMFNKSFPTAKIYSFEPVANTFDRLIINTKTCSKISSFKLALADTDGPVDIRIFEDIDSELNSLSEIAMNNSDKFEIERIDVATGDKFCAENQISTIDLLKIDTEGYEIQVLKGFSKMIEQGKIKAIYCEVGLSPINKRNTFINDLLDFTLGIGYSFYGLYDVRNYQIVGGGNYGNVLLVKDEFLVNQPDI